MINLSLPLILALGFLFLVVVILLLIWRTRSIKTIKRTSTALGSQMPQDMANQQSPMNAPKLEDIIPERVGQKGFSSQLQTSTYNIRIETINDRTRYVVNGVTYNHLDNIPDPEMRRMADKLYQKTVRGQDIWGSQSETLRQVLIGNQKTIEARTPSHTLSIQKDKQQTRYLVDGLTYYNMKEIPDPEMIRKAKELEHKML
jgi:hypothetical protein